MVNIPFFLSFLLFISCSSPQNQKGDAKSVTTPLINSAPSLEGKNFIDVTKKMGLEEAFAVHLYAVDFDHDGYTDVVTLPDFYSMPEFFRYEPALSTFIKVESSLFKTDIHASYLIFLNLNNDSLPDLIAGTFNQKESILNSPLRFFIAKKEGDSFSYQEKAVSFPNNLPTTTAIPFDFDLDGDLDLYLSNWLKTENGKNSPTESLLFQNNSGEYSVRNDLFVRSKDDKNFIIRPTYGASVCDVDQNGRPDILIPVSAGLQNEMWMNVQDKQSKETRFTNEGKRSGLAEDLDTSGGEASGGNSLFADCFDYNNDSFIDVYLGELSHSYDPLSRDRSSILSGATPHYPPKFLRTEVYLEDGSMNWNQADNRTLFVDYNMDGLIDIVVENSGFPPKSRLVLFKQAKDHGYEDMAKGEGVDLVNPSGAVTLDFNRDSKPDLLVGQTSIRGNIKKRVYLFENQFQATDRLPMTIQLEGAQNNLAALGARLILEHDGIKETRYHSFINGALPSMSANEHYFAPTLQTKKLKLKVIWPFVDLKNEIIVQEYDLLPFLKKKKGRLMIHFKNKTISAL